MRLKSLSGGTFIKAKPKKSRQGNGKHSKPKAGSRSVPWTGQAMIELVTLERLKELMTYDPETGIFTRNIDRGCHKKGTQVGSVAKSGYLKTLINGKNYYLHRLAYFYMTGEWPLEYIDHIRYEQAGQCLV